MPFLEEVDVYWVDICALVVESSVRGALPSQERY